jgi:hypothetical protein
MMPRSNLLSIHGVFAEFFDNCKTVISLEIVMPRQMLNGKQSFPQISSNLQKRIELIWRILFVQSKRL